MCVWLCVHIHVYTCEVLRTSLAVVPRVLSIIYFEAGSWICRSLVGSEAGWPPHPRNPPTYVFLVYPNWRVNKICSLQGKAFLLQKCLFLGCSLALVQASVQKRVPSEQTVHDIKDKFLLTSQLRCPCAFYVSLWVLQGKFMKNKDTKEEKQHFSRLELQNSNRPKVEKVGDEEKAEGSGKSSWENKCTEGIFLSRNFHNLPRPSDQQVIKNEVKRMCFQNPVGEGSPTVIWRSCQKDRCLKSQRKRRG